MSKQDFFTTHATAHVLLFSCHFVPTYIHPPAWLSAPGMPVQHSRGPPGEQTHTGGYVALPQSPPPPRPHSFPVALCLPPPAAPGPSLQSPASLPYDLDADKTRGPAVPSAWCHHFPLIQSLPCCVTDGIGDQKQLQSLFDNGPTTEIHF